MSITSELSTEVVEISAVPTELGWFSFALNQSQVLSVTIGDRSKNASRRRLRAKLSEIVPEAEIQDAASPLADELGRDLQRFAAGERVDFEKYEVSSNHLTDFQQKVRDAVREIPAGETLSYAEVAERAGSPRAARAVGNVMANNQTPIVVPCHRVLASGGKWGGFTAPGGVDLKRRLLSLEANS